MVDIYHELKQFGVHVTVYDPWADAVEVAAEYGIQIIPAVPETACYDGIVIAVAHREFLQFDFNRHKHGNTVIFDTKACIDRNIVDCRL